MTDHPGRAPRRLTQAQRHEQLVTAAMPILARRGFGSFSLEAIAGRADVTRNLLYHYFPRGRQDIVLAVVHRAGEQLTAGLTDAPGPGGELAPAPLAASGPSPPPSLARIMDHALARTHAWRIHRMARATLDPEVDRLVERFVDAVISAIARERLLGSEPLPLLRLALQGFVAFAETVVEQARSRRIPRRQTGELLAAALSATIASVPGSG